MTFLTTTRGRQGCCAGLTLEGIWESRSLRENSQHPLPALVLCCPLSHWPHQPDSAAELWWLRWTLPSTALATDWIKDFHSNLIKETEQHLFVDSETNWHCGVSTSQMAAGLDRSSAGKWPTSFSRLKQLSFRKPLPVTDNRLDFTSLQSLPLAERKLLPYQQETHCSEQGRAESCCCVYLFW